MEDDYPYKYNLNGKQLCPICEENNNDGGLVAIEYNGAYFPDVVVCSDCYETYKKTTFCFSDE